jgi:hypothetical protein
MISKQNICDQLNKLLNLDPKLIEQLVDTRHEVSPAYQNANEFVWSYDDELVPRAGLIGVLNGLLEVDGQQICANYSNTTNELIGFSLIVPDTDRSPPMPSQTLTGEEVIE